MKAATLLFGLAALVAGHPLAPSSLKLVVDEGGHVEVTWRAPAVQPSGAAVEPIWPARCAVVEPLRTVLEERTLVEQRGRLACGAEGLAGAALEVRGLDTSRTNALVHVTTPDGSVHQALLHAGKPRFTIARPPSACEVAWSYGVLGVEHLWTGLDHVLFVLGLLLLVRGMRSLVIAVTAFTLGHSVTLALATLGLLSLSPPLVEVAIAATLVALAVEAAGRTADSPPGLIARRPGRLCAAFGLVHGLGFAGVLSELGLPPNSVPISLASFNVGLEVGQLALILAALLVVRVAAPVARRVGTLPAAYVIGSLGACWVIQRTVWLVSSG